MFTSLIHFNKSSQPEHLAWPTVCLPALATLLSTTDTNFKRIPNTYSTYTFFWVCGYIYGFICISASNDDIRWYLIQRSFYFQSLQLLVKCTEMWVSPPHLRLYKNILSFPSNLGFFPFSLAWACSLLTKLMFTEKKYGSR